MKFSVFIFCVLQTFTYAQFGYYRSGDQYRLIGTSFGLLGSNATYDYVIVGGGTAGLAVANRLAAVPGSSVAVVEAGSFYEISNSNHSQIPAWDYYGSSFNLTDIPPLVDWAVITQPQPQLGGRRLHYAQGKCFGGGSARNFMAYHRGTVGSYDAWANAVGDQSYEFSNLLPFFQKSVNFTPPNYEKRGAGGTVDFNSSAFASSGGPLHLSYANYWAPISTYTQKAFAALGLTSVLGFNTGQLLGYAEFTDTVDPTAATRSSSETSFLQESVASTTIQIYPQTIAEQVVFGANKTVTGVKVNTAGFPYFLSARKEVIVSAGAFRSSQLLMLSGIGPSATLQSLNIPSVSVLEGVGQNLWDQPYFGATYQVNVTTQSQLTENATYLAEATEDYLKNQKGPLVIGGGQIVGFEKLPSSLRQNLSNQTLKDLATFPTDWPEIEILMRGLAGGPVNSSGNYMYINIAMVATTSRGNVTINSTSASDNPIISPNWLSTTTDQELAVQSFKRIRQVATAMGITVGPEVIPGPSVQSDAEILAYIKSVMGAIYHASASNSMGKRGDPRAVLDSRGRVFGVNGLRVIDISAFPLLPPGHPQASVYALAEKLAQDIIDDHAQ